MFIVFEGVDGSGKSTQLQRCHTWLDESGQDVVVCRDPGSTGLGDRLRQVLLDKSDLNIDPVSETFLFMAARAQLVREVILPARQENRIVLCDRFLMSTVVYQGYAGSLDPQTVRQIGETATAGLQPDLTLVFDTSVDVAMGRMGQHLDRMESRGEEFMETVRRGFLSESAASPCSTVIDASGDPADIQQLVRRAVQSCLDHRSTEQPQPDSRA